MGAGIKAKNGCAASGGRQKTGKQFQCGGFARAIGAEQAQYFTLFDLEAKVVEHRFACKMSG